MPKAQAKHRVAEVIAFGEKLIKTEDLDPVYCTLVRASLPREQLYRLLLAYFCFYHLGAAAYLSEWEGEEFWLLMENAASNEIPPNMNGELPRGRWPRGSERRHFRGSKCVAAVKKIEEFSASKSGPETFVGVLAELGQLVKLEGLMDAVQAFPMMGPWISFKVADILERVLGVSVVFPNDLTLFYAEPRAALEMLDVPAEEANLKLLKHFGRIKAPPRYERFCNSQEVETIACKTRSFWHGKYWVGKDIHEIRKGLVGWGETATRILREMPPEVGEGLFV
jgi:hypothetical protein